MFMLCDCITKCLKQSKYEEIEDNKFRKYLWFLLFVFIYLIHNIHNFIAIYQTFTFSIPNNISIPNNCSIVLTHFKLVSFINLVVSAITCLLFMVYVVRPLQNNYNEFTFERFLFLSGYTLYCVNGISTMINAHFILNECELNQFDYLIYLNLIYIIYIYILALLMLANIMLYLAMFLFSLWAVWYSMVGRDYDYDD